MLEDSSTHSHVAYLTYTLDLVGNLYPLTLCYINLLTHCVTYFHAPMLFCLAIDWIMSQCSSALGIDIGQWKFTDQVYADDAALFTSDAAKWPTALMAFDSAAATMRLHTSWIKTKVQNLGSGPPASSVDVANKRVESGTRFTYLGSDLDCSGYCTPEILRRIGIASAVFGRLDDIWKQSRLSLQTKLRIYTSWAQSSLLHGADTWTIIKADGERLQTFHMQCQRHILDIWWSDFITNSGVKHLLKGTPAHDTMTPFLHRLNHTLAWYHVLAGKESQDDHHALGYVTY